jgi:hypothetical protein
MPADPIAGRIHTDICARCGCDRREQRRDGFGCRSWGRDYPRHMWGWPDPDHDPQWCGSCGGDTNGPAALGVPEDEGQ